MRAIGRSLVVLTFAAAFAPVGSAAPAGLHLSSTSGAGAFVSGPSCRTGGSTILAGAYHFRYAGVASGHPVPLATSFEADLDVHRELVVQDGSVVDVGLAALDSNVLRVSTVRGDLFGRLEAGTCDGGGVVFDETPSGTVARGTGRWVVTGGTRSLAAASGGGPLTFEAAVADGVANVLGAELGGSVTVPAPAMTAPPVRAFYPTLVDWLLGQATVVFRVFDEGPGDGFNVAFSVVPAEPGVEVADEGEADIGELDAGDARDVAIRFRTGKPACVLGCAFAIHTTVAFTDAVDGAVPERVDDVQVDPSLPIRI
jgi:hypothetical protein